MLEHPYASFLHLIQKPGRYTGGEYGSIIKKSCDLRMALCFPDIYELGHSYLGLGILYSIINSEKAMSVERVFSPWRDMEEALRERHLPLVSLETSTTLNDFDVIGFSLTYELCATNVLQILDLGRIPLQSDSRDGSHPLIMAGGPLAMHPEPLAPFIDLFVLGDAEDVIVPVLNEIRKMKGLDRHEMLRRLSERPEVYVPSLVKVKKSCSFLCAADYGPVKPAGRRAVSTSVRDDHVPLNPLVPGVEVSFDRYSVEVARGCSNGCRFCQAGILNRPVRERTTRMLTDSIKCAVRNSGFSEVSLSSLSLSDYAGLEELSQALYRELSPGRTAVSLSSLKAYALPRDVLRAVSGVRTSGMTLAPEAGTQRLRNVINKNIRMEDILDGASQIFSTGHSRIKLYFMIGLPTETDEDVRAIVECAMAVLSTGRRYVKGRRCEVTVSVSNFIPKPHTPFQWEPFISDEVLEHRRKILVDGCRGMPLKLKLHNAGLSALEAVLSRGDRQLAPVIRTAYENGARFDAWDDVHDESAWADAFAITGIDPELYRRGIEPGQRTPWDHLSSAVTSEFLLHEYQKSLKEETTPPCGVYVLDGEQNFICHNCGLKCKKAESHRIRPSEPERTNAEFMAHKPEPAFVEHARPFPFRLIYSCTSRFVFLGHLDRSRAVMRTLRRAGAGPLFSQGFHPQPKVVFAPPVPLGTIGLGEIADAVLEKDMQPEELLEILNSRAPEGLRFLRARPVTAGEKNPAAALECSDWAVIFPGMINGSTEAEELKKSIDDFNLSSSIVITKTSKKKKRKRSLDLKPLVRDLSVHSLNETKWEAPFSADEIMPRKCDPETLVMNFRLCRMPDKTAGVADVLKLMNMEKLHDALIIRRKLWARHADCLYPLFDPPPS